LLANSATDLITAWCWLSNLWRSLPTTFGVGYQIYGGVCQQRLVLVIKSAAEIVNNAYRCGLHYKKNVFDNEAMEI
jgi:hypothetical protein